jgi:hypothetical protein
MPENSQFSLRTLFAFVTACAILLGVCSVAAVFVNPTWTEPARVGRNADDQFRLLFTQRRWRGHAAAFHYDHRVRIDSVAIGDSELQELYPILREITWLRDIELCNTNVTSKGIAQLQTDFPECRISLND